MKIHSMIGPLIGVVGAVALIGGALFLREMPHAESHTLTLTAPQRVPSEEGADFDNDGVPNWKERLFGTDPHNPDSDGDGIPDSEFVAQKTSEGLFGSNETYVAPPGLAPTEALARELFASYASVRQDGVIAEEEIDTAIADILNRQPETALTYTEYSLNDIRFEYDVSLSAYQGSLARILGESKAVREYEVAVFSRLVNGGGQREIIVLSQAASIYAEIQKNLSQIEAPHEARFEHLETINAIGALSASVDALTIWSGDPLEALILVNQYTKTEARAGEAIEALYRKIRELS